MVATTNDCNMLPYDPSERRVPTDFFPDDEYYNSSNDSKIDAIHEARDWDASEGEDSGQATNVSTCIL
ncbi:hypothetical protein P691DRAFT_812295 [Macrolepiota fuliginosa MF-IS2]|uniref:Uncharacterized protein n=1 Tax=Macrolepiota fuliginosa MF-IS2 TaxID=1400762 RepID=A0A9P6BXX7_9AGAR|nr:hypothetical protein P691DRAFT_811308 [Macrolepiota fuliginosa MF-IS2]KAF9449529.1 hypothetical protein P691DRAFT_812295 [Macrolepiota fuliginosa MF-IS2]